jgi:hypothetical protein
LRGEEEGGDEGGGERTRREKEEGGRGERKKFEWILVQPLDTYEYTIITSGPHPKHAKFIGFS